MKRNVVSPNGVVIENVFSVEIAAGLENTVQRGAATVACQGVAGALDHGGGAGIGFQAPPAAAAALPGFGHFNDHMSQFGPVAVLALDDAGGQRRGALRQADPAE